MSGHTRTGQVLSDSTTGDLLGHTCASGREFAHPGARADSSGTPGAATQHVTQGRCAIAAAASAVVITNRNVNPQSTVVAILTGAAADATLTSIVRVTPGAGSFTINGNANATAATQVDYLVFGPLNPI